jgi:glyoxylate reductase
VPETRHLIDRMALSRMKRTAYLINTSRGPVVDEEALAWALGEGIIKGAGLDVYEDEPRVHKGLLALDNVVLVPHLATATSDTRGAMYDLVARNVINVLTGKPPITPIP